MTRVLYPAPFLLTVKGPTYGRWEDHKRGTLWTDREVTWLLHNYPRFTTRYCAHHLRRSESAVIAKANGMGLKAKSAPTEMTMKDVLARFTEQRAAS